MTATVTQPHTTSSDTTCEIVSQSRSASQTHDYEQFNSNAVFEERCPLGTTTPTVATGANADHCAHLWFVLPTCTRHHQATTTSTTLPTTGPLPSSPCLASPSAQSSSSSPASWQPQAVKKPCGARKDDGLTPAASSRDPVSYRCSACVRRYKANSLSNATLAAWKY